MFLSAAPVILFFFLVSHLSLLVSCLIFLSIFVLTSWDTCSAGWGASVGLGDPRIVASTYMRETLAALYPMPRGYCGDSDNKECLCTPLLPSIEYSRNVGKKYIPTATVYEDDKREERVCKCHRPAAGPPTQENFEK
jgi:hypothetical protein